MKSRIKDALRDYLPSPILRLYQKLYVRTNIIWPSYWGDYFGILSPDSIYDEDYYTQHLKWRGDSHRIATAIVKQENPTSVLDLGCGIGLHLEGFENQGCTVHGVDGSKKALENSVLEETQIENHDLRRPYETTQSYDVVLCFEVLEHIPQRYAATLVESIVKAGDVAYVSAATPGQSGKHHVNLQSQEYWIDLFERYGAEYDEISVEQLRNKVDIDSTDWILDNLMVFR